jgi:peptidoglycan/xylan/chitin deacetylase (PgdA/CDA1 family)
MSVTGFACICLAVLGCDRLAFGAKAPASDRHNGATVVSLEFDDATSDQMAGVRLAAGNGMNVTLFVPSGLLGTPGFMDAEELRELEAQGNEIGGHTVDHKDLSQLSPADQLHQVCDDRVALEADGVKVTDFAYPFGNGTAETPGIVRACGYESARDDGGLSSEGGCYGACPPVERIPPADPYETRTIYPVLSTTGLSTIESYVTRAEALGGGWVQLIFHRVCDGCDLYSISEGTLTGFLAWLAARSPIGTRVETVRQVINTPFRPRPIKVWGQAARSLRLRPVIRCPSTPVTAACTRDPWVRPPSLRIPRGTPLTLRANSPATRVELQTTKYGRFGTRVEVHHRAHRIGKAGYRWRLEPGAISARTSTLAVTYPFGVASYRFRLRRHPTPR